jgi:hypothetical protein
MRRILVAAILLAGCAQAPSPPPAELPAKLTVTVVDDGVNPEWFFLSVTDDGTSIVAEQRMVLPGQQSSWSMPMAIGHAIHYEVRAANTPAQEPGWGWHDDLDSTLCPGGTWDLRVTVGYLTNGEPSSHIGVHGTCTGAP